MAACGQASAHWLHWMQTSGSQIGISSARLRFSQRVVPMGQVPSTGKAETGSRSPLPAIITAVTFCTKSGASAATTGGRWRVDQETVPKGREGRPRGHGHLAEVLQGGVHPLEVA